MTAPTVFLSTAQWRAMEVAAAWERVTTSNWTHMPDATINGRVANALIELGLLVWVRSMPTAREVSITEAGRRLMAPKAAS